MKDGKPDWTGRPEGNRLASGGRRNGSSGRQRSFVDRATARDHSGHGSDSVRPHLRDQLRLKALMPQPFPMPEQQPQPGKDEHHR